MSAKAEIKDGFWLALGFFPSGVCATFVLGAVKHGGC